MDLETKRNHLIRIKNSLLTAMGSATEVGGAYYEEIEGLYQQARKELKEIERALFQVEVGTDNEAGEIIWVEDGN